VGGKAKQASFRARTTNVVQELPKDCEAQAREEEAKEERGAPHLFDPSDNTGRELDALLPSSISRPNICRKRPHLKFEPARHDLRMYKSILHYKWCEMVCASACSFVCGCLPCWPANDSGRVERACLHNAFS
jgi:hypothetical protein